MGQTTAGTTFGVSLTLAATPDATGYNALTPNLVGEVTDIGTLGRLYALVTSQPLGVRRVKKYKGSYNEGSFDIVYDKTESDAGQSDLDTAHKQDANVAIVITNQDGSKICFEAKVMSFQAAIGGSDSMYEGNTNIEIDSDIVYIPAP